MVLNQPRESERVVVRMKLVGARPAAQWEALEKQPGISNYFLGNDPAKWRTGVPNYARVEARGVYPGVDMICYGNRSQIEYDLAVAPGADPGQVQLAWEGADSLRLNAEGDLVLATKLGDIVQKRPRVYQDIGGERVDVASKYVLAGGTRVRATDFPIQAPYQSKLKATWGSAFVSKLSPAGNALVYSTYLGGSNLDWGMAIAVDASGSAYVTGGTFSTDFPTQSPYQSILKSGHGYNAFVTKFSPAGNSLVYSTYLGGSQEETSQAIAVDAAGSAYITGMTDSFDYPTQSAYQSANYASAGTVFVAKFAPGGNTLVWSTFLGGSFFEWAYGIAVDAVGSAYVTGISSSKNFPVTSAYQSVNNTTDNGGNAFVTKFSPSGTTLIYSTYLGGSTGDGGNAIAVDAAGSAYVAGHAFSSDFPTQLAYQTSLKGKEDAFVTKLSPAGNTLVYSTYLGGSGTGTAAMRQRASRWTPPVRPMSPETPARPISPPSPPTRKPTQEPAARFS